jgi:plastocyanin
MQSTLSALAFGVLATSVLAAPQSSESSGAVHQVQVGPGLTFTPDTLMAAQGDWVEFTFGAGHSVAQSTFDAPCVPMSDGAGVYSGFPNDGDVWRFMVNSTDPLWLYCSATQHCEGGMSMVVNPP